MKKLKLNQLNAVPALDFVAALANVFEFSPWIAEAAERQRPFATLAAMRDSLLDIVATAPRDQRLKLIHAHPDLANKTQRAAGLTDDSASEQDSAGLDRLSDAEFAAFDLSNTAYQTRFGFPFIVCVRRHTRDSILAQFAHRLQNDTATEEKQALAEIARIATLRLAQLVEAPDALPVHGRLSTHVLDTHGGQPAAGVGIELVELSRLGADRTIVRATSNDDGRTDQPLIHGRPLPIGSYELRFSVGDYFSKRIVAQSDPPFLDMIPIRFSIAEPESHLHVPLLVTPWSYATYRGS